MKKLLQELRASSLEAIGNADNSEALEALRVKYLGKKGELTAVLKQMGRLSAEERPVMGKLANEVRADLEQALADCKTRLEARALERRLEQETLDVTLPESEDFDTLGGLIFSRFSTIPQDGTTPCLKLYCTRDGEKPEEGDAPQIEIQVEAIEDRRVEWAKVTVVPIDEGAKNEEA